MDFRSNKLEIAIVVLALMMVGGLMKAFGLFKDRPMTDAQDISYEMPRPKSDLVGDFDLNGREIDRRYVNPFEKKKADGKVTAANAAGIRSAEKKNAQKTAAKKTDDKKKKTEIDVVDADKKDGVESTLEGGAQQQVVSNRNTRETAGDKSETQTETLSPDQWRALMAAQPTIDNMNKLADAVIKGEVDEDTFGAIVLDLLKSQNKENQSVGLAGLAKVQTLKSFTLIATEYENLPADVKPGAQQFLNGYAAASKHNVLLMALEETDSVVAVKAAEVVLTGLQQIQNGTISDPRQARGEVQNQGLDSFTHFVSVFQGWASSGDAQLQGLASSILSLLPAAQA